MARKYVFNLLQPLLEPKTYWDKIYDWLLTRARVIIIVVEIAIIIAFGAKIVVDNIGKNREQTYDSIKTEVDVVSANNESKFRQIQLKEVEYRKIWTNANLYQLVLEELNTYIEFNNSISITLDQDNLTVAGFQDLDMVNDLETSMKVSDTFVDVLTTLNLNEQDIIDNFGQFTITTKISEEVNQRIGLTL